jgi:hypothetical protein
VTEFAQRDPAIVSALANSGLSAKALSKLARRLLGPPQRRLNKTAIR